MFHPAVAAWFERTFRAPTAAQTQAWPTIKAGRNVLVAAPTGSGKTFAAFMAAIDDLVRQGLDGGLPDETQVVYVSPLKALSNDIQKNLDVPLSGIRAALREQRLSDVEIRTWVRDTSAGESQRMGRRPPHIVVTTPESLYVLLASNTGRRMLATTRTVDEIHAVAPNKRGSHLALSLERLARLCGDRLLRIGLSATQKPIEEVAWFLVGVEDGAPVINALASLKWSVKAFREPAVNRSDGAHPLVGSTEPIPRAGSSTPRSISRICKFAFIDGKASASDALRQSRSETLKLSNPLIDAFCPRAREARPVLTGRNTI
jgi:Lhr-like helicase